MLGRTHGELHVVVQPAGGEQRALDIFPRFKRHGLHEPERPGQLPGAAEQVDHAGVVHLPPLHAVVSHRAEDPEPVVDQSAVRASRKHGHEADAVGRNALRQHKVEQVQCLDAMTVAPVSLDH